MDGISNLIGDRHATVEISGKEYKLSTRVLKDFAELESFVLSLRPNPMDVLESVPESLKDKFADRAWKEATRSQYITWDELGEFEKSPIGIAFRLWRAMREHHPEIDSVQAAMSFMEMLGNEGLKSFLAAVDIAEERDILGKSDGRTAGQDQSVPVGDCRGHSYSVTSPNAMAGAGEK